ILASDVVGEGGRDTEPLEWDFGLVGFGETFRDGAAQACGDAVLFESDDTASLAGCGKNCGGVEGLEGVHAQDADGDSFCGEVIGDANGCFEQRAGGNKSQSVAIADLNGLSELEIGFKIVNSRLTGATEAQIAGAMVRGGGARGFRRFPGIAGRNDGDFR